MVVETQGESEMKELELELIRKLEEAGIVLHKKDLNVLVFKSNDNFFARFCALFISNDLKFVTTYPTEIPFIGNDVDEMVDFVKDYITLSNGEVKMNHGLRHNRKVDEFVADTKDSEFVYLKFNGQRVIKQKKESTGKRFRQGTNPDYEGFYVYPLYYFDGKEWRIYDSNAQKKDIINQISRLKESLGVL